LLDEIEKAHPDVYNILLQVMDEGQLTDSLGRRVDFRNTIVIMTSNIGTRQLKDFGQGVGFSTSSKQTSANEFAKSVIQNALKKTFSPEFLNRIDDVVIFNALDREDIHKIIDIELKGLFNRVLALGFSIQLTKEAKDFIAERGFDIQFGARPLKRAIQKYLEDPMAEVIIKTDLQPGDSIDVDLDKEKDEIIMRVVPRTQELAGDKDSEKKKSK
jgi:ATP-dependent Clp protease ATP-binding subunit ClpC